MTLPSTKDMLLYLSNVLLTFRFSRCYDHGLEEPSEPAVMQYTGARRTRFVERSTGGRGIRLHLRWDCM